MEHNNLEDLADLEELTTAADVERVRAAADPVVFPERTQGYEGFVPDHLFEDIIEQRLALVDETPNDEPVPRATWAEVVAYCLAASGDGALASSNVFVGLYSYAFRQHLDIINDNDGDEMLPASFIETSDAFITEQARDKADQLRREIKRSRDRYFTDEVYDALPIEGVPKAVWSCSH